MVVYSRRPTASPDVETRASDQPASPRRPNIVLISIDAVRPDHLSCYGYARPTSPNLDRLARQGILFKQCRAQAPWTLPSHMSLFTSMLPSHNGVDNLNKVLPPTLVTLAQVMSQEGYRTTAIVNNGQMRAHWGFDRGFEMWKEFEADTPAGTAGQLTDSAIASLNSTRSDSPHFLFLHYYDAHDPYEAPLPWRDKFGVTIDGQRSRSLCNSNRTPAHNITDPTELEQLKLAYDAEIAFMDHEIGRLIDVVGPETLVVVFSDHGECFEEHGWTLHGATLFDQDIRTVLIVRPPASWRVTPSISDMSVMLLDVAPTVLAMAGARPHPQFVGVDLSGLWRGDPPLPTRFIPSETKAVVEGRYLLAVTAGNLKAIYSLFDGTLELRRLPEEQEGRYSTQELASAEALYSQLRQWIRGEQFWLLEASGDGDHEVRVQCPDSGLAMFIPAGLDHERDSFDVSPDGKSVRWHVYPAAARERKKLLLQASTSDVPLELDYLHNGERNVALVRLGADAAQPLSLPVRLDASVLPSDPLVLASPNDRPPNSGLRITRHADALRNRRDTMVVPLDEQTRRQLRSLGYIQ
ncbi:MAG: sulfatase [Planctomycetota bacterium]|nr:sulfatase [Planctomycetota bacterium]